MFIDVIGSVSVSARQHRHNGATTRYELLNMATVAAAAAASRRWKLIHMGKIEFIVTLQFGFLLCCLAPSSRTVSCGLHNCNIEPSRTKTK